jgi:hypothetical protein
VKEREIPSLRRSLIGLTLLVLTIAGGFFALNRASRSSLPEGSEGVLLRYTRSGGLAGETATLEVRDDGRATATFDRGTEVKERSFEVSEAERTDLEEIFQEAPWPEVSQSFPFPEGSADIFQYDVNYRGVAVKSYDPLRPRIRPVVLHIERELMPEQFSAFR